MNDVRVEDHTDEYKKAMAVAVNNALTKIGGLIEGEAKDELENSPRRVDTARLKNSITNKVDGDVVYIGTNVEYAIYVHEGTRRMTPNRFLRNAVERNEDQIVKIIENNIKDALK
ncbi:MAG: HK97 gp10 family phage protein [Oscillospiraceae bacterium]|nr:HK97 gp10 family phage protein [Oscillospiraceae bacterium]